MTFTLAAKEKIACHTDFLAISREAALMLRFKYLPSIIFENNMDTTNIIALAMGSSWVSGINLYAAVASLGLLGRFAHLPLPSGLQPLMNWWVIGVAGALYLVEFLADKIPYIDSAWDAIHTFIRVPAGAVLAFAAFSDFDPTIKTVAGLIGGGLALSAHGTKAATRATINTSPEPVTNIAASLGEDALAFGFISLAAYYPVILIVLVCVAVVVSFIVIPKIIRVFRSFGERMNATRDRFWGVKN
jgi:hypothetical protein